jgi:hypothetical protein
MGTTGEFDREKTLEQLEGDVWHDPSFDSSLVTRCHALRRKPLRDFAVEDLRMMIGQGIGLRYLVPLAIQRLREDPFCEGDMYRGDLLMSVLKTAKPFWVAHPHLWWEVDQIVDEVRFVGQTIEDAILPAANQFDEARPE